MICNWFAEDAGLQPDGVTFVVVSCLVCGKTEYLSPDPWLNAETLQAKPPQCPLDLRQGLLSL